MREGLLLLKQLSIFIAVSLAYLSLLTSLSVSASAQGVNDFVITEFDATYSLTNEDPQGLLTVTERIELDFSGQNQGILRAIPNSYKGNDMNLRVISIERSVDVDSEIVKYTQEPYIAYQENDNTVLRIGQEGKFITGEHEYILNYQLENVVSFYEEYDEFFWDVNGDQWLQPFENVQVELQTAAKKFEALQAKCFTGDPGSTQTNCEVFEQTNGLDARTTETLLPGQTLTIVQAYNKGYFTPPSWFENNRGLLLAAPIVAMQALVVHAAHKKWRLLGKDPKKRGIVAPYFERPKRVSVMEASYVLEKNLLPKHLSAGIIDLAIRGYIKITELKKGKKVRHNLELAELPDDSISPGELELLEGLFGDLELGKIVELESKKHKLSGTLSKLQKTVDTQTSAKGFFALAPKNALGSMVREILLSLVLLIIGFIFAEVTNGISLIFGAITCVAVFVYASLMTKRTTKGNTLVEHMEGLKLYLSKAEKDRMKMQDAVAAPLARNSDQPKRTVEFFESLLPYAVAMGVEKSWAGAFDEIYTEPPEWYAGSWNTFTTATLLSSLQTTMKVTNQSFASPSSSGGSGFSGGSAGGGGGGGGGGGW